LGLGGVDKFGEVAFVKRVVRGVVRVVMGVEVPFHPVRERKKEKIEIVSRAILTVSASQRYSCATGSSALAPSQLPSSSPPNSPRSSFSRSLASLYLQSPEGRSSCQQVLPLRAVNRTRLGHFVNAAGDSVVAVGVRCCTDKCATVQASEERVSSRRYA
jgi:hypothetical protein